MNYLPGIVLSILTATLIGSIMHIWRGGELLKLFVLIVFACAGFAVGQIVGTNLSSEFFLVGWVQMGWGISISVLSAAFGAWLINIRIDNNK